ncbi:MAG: flagellar basal body-associated FliL family protein [Pseudomonadota bacterium]
MAEEKKTSDAAHAPAEGSESPPASPSKFKQLTSDKKRLGALLFVIVLVISGAVGFALWWKKTREAAHGHNKPAVKSSQSANDEEEDDSGHPPIFMPIDKIVVKLRRGTAPVDHYLQVAIDLRLSNAKVNEKIKQYLPIIQHECMLILSSKEFDWLDDVNHKKQLAVELKEKINKIIKGTPVDGVRAVYFDSFILQ